MQVPLLIFSETHPSRFSGGSWAMDCKPTRHRVESSSVFLFFYNCVWPWLIYETNCKWDDLTGGQTYCCLSFLAQIRSVLLLARSFVNVKLFGLHFELQCFSIAGVNIWSSLIVYHISHVPTSWNRLGYFPVYSNTSLLIKWLKGKAIPVTGRGGP
jgi:hypothetical protein